MKIYFFSIGLCFLMFGCIEKFIYDCQGDSIYIWKIEFTGKQICSPDGKEMLHVPDTLESKVFSLTQLKRQRQFE